MHKNSFAVRILKPEPRPFLPKRAVKPKIVKAGIIEIIFGSSLGAIVGLIIFTLLSVTGVSLGSLEASLLIGLPAALGIIASLVIF